MSGDTPDCEKQKVAEKKPFIALTMGSTWTDLFEESLARKMAGIEHVRLGNPRYILPEELFHRGIAPAEGVKGLLPPTAKKLWERLNSPSIQASELVFKFEWFATFGSILFIDSKLLDKAIGQFTIAAAKQAGCPVYGVATDHNSSPLAAAFLKATLYPENPDDLVKVCLQHA